LLVQGLTVKCLLGKLHLLDDQLLQEQSLAFIARRDALNHVAIHLNQASTQLALSSKMQRSQLEFVQQQLQQPQLEIQERQEQHAQLKAFSVQQHQKELLAIEASTLQNLCSLAY